MADTERRRELELGPLPPWHTVIRVDAVQTNHGRRTLLPHDWLFEISAEWVGPPAVGMPFTRDPVFSRDVVVVTSLEEAKAVAYRAAEEFRKGGDEPPDLREFLARNNDAFTPPHRNGVHN
jgi:hypothetical protein